MRSRSRLAAGVLMFAASPAIAQPQMRSTTRSSDGADAPSEDHATHPRPTLPPTTAAPAEEPGPEDDAPPSQSPPADESPGPALPEGMTLDEVLARAARPPPDDFPDAIDDDRLLAFFLADQFEYRVDGKTEPDVLGWEADAWIGGDFNRLWLKPEGEATFHSPGSFEAETDVLYSRLIAPFWSAQIGFQYAHEWESGGDYRDRWSGAVAIQGLAPGKFEVEASAYVSEAADVSAVLEVEYDWRLTQRLVAQPRTELAFAFQDVPDRNLGAGLTDIVAGLRFRYEILREFAPYAGVRYQGRVFESADRTRDAGEPVWRFFGVAGLRFAFL